MPTRISPLAGKPAPRSLLINVPQVVSAYYTGVPDPSVLAQQVSFGTSGHRGRSLDLSFNEAHVLAITQAICNYRHSQGISGPLYLGMDTHALSWPATASALEVLAANGVDVVLAANDEYTPTPAISHAILIYNKDRNSGMADGIIVTPSHNPPDNGGFKYNPPNGGPASQTVTDLIQNQANDLLKQAPSHIKRMPYLRALRATTTHRHDFMTAYIADLVHVIEFDIIRNSKIRVGVDPLGGAGVHYWPRIAEHYRIDLNVISDVVDPTFSFMTVDWDGQIRMDPSSPYAMQRLQRMKDHFDIAFACDTDHDRHGIVTRQSGLMMPNHYLTVAIDYLFRHRPHWNPDASIGKTIVSTRLIDLVASCLDRTLYEVPVGFKWFADGLLDGTLGFSGEESAGASFLRRDGTVWTTDKDGLIPALLAAEMTARCRTDPSNMYTKLTDQLGKPVGGRIDAPASSRQKQQLGSLTAKRLTALELAGEKIVATLDRAPGNNAPIGGIKVISENGWFAARPSGTEDIYKIYAESFIGNDHLQHIFKEAQTIVNRAIESP